MPQVQAYYVDDAQHEKITNAKKKLEADHGEAGALALIMEKGADAVLADAPAAAASAPAKKAAAKRK